MLRTLRNVWKIKDLRRRIGFTFLMLIVVRLGSQLPLPGINRELFSSMFASGDVWNFFNTITGGSFEQMSVFALNIAPYITASIIIQLLTVVFPKLEEIQRDGEDGKKRINKITRYVTVGLALAQSIAMAIGFGRAGYLTSFTFLSVLLMVVALTAGSAVLMWIGEKITEHGIGNGISIVLVINILSRIPGDLTTLYQQFVSGQPIARAVLSAVIILLIIAAMVILVVILQGAERRIPVQYSKRVPGSQIPSGLRNDIPLKVNTAGVIPVIFAQSLMQTPIIIAALVGYTGGTSVGGRILRGLNQAYWFNPSNWIYTLGAVLYLVLLIAFAYFYTSITFNPYEIADNLKKQGASIPGVRPGKPTCEYLQSILRYIIFIGAVGLAIIAFIPIILNGLFSASVSFGGTSLIIVVGVVIETIKQAEAQMKVRNYKGFLGK